MVEAQGERERHAGPPRDLHDVEVVSREHSGQPASKAAPKAVSLRSPGITTVYLA